MRGMTTSQLPLRTVRIAAGQYELVDGTHRVGRVERLFAGEWFVSVGDAANTFATLPRAFSWADQQDRS